MGVPDSSLVDLIEKIRSWGTWGRAEFSSFNTTEIIMAKISCSECELKFSELCHTYSCQGCRRLLCGSCVRTSGSLVIIATSNGSKDVDHIEKVIKACKFCSKSSKKHIEKVYPSESPRTSPEPPSPLGGEKIEGHEDAKIGYDDCVRRSDEFSDHTLSPHNMRCERFKSFDGHPSHTFHRNSPIQSDEEPEESGRHFFSTSSDYYHDSSDIDTGSVSFRHESYSFRSTGSSPLDSPSRFNINTPRARLAVQHPRCESPRPQDSSPLSQRRMAVLKRPDRETGDPENSDSQSDEMTTIKQDEKFVKTLDFENNDHIWFPPPPEDENDEAESSYFQYDDDDDDDNHANVIGHSSGAFSSSSFSNLFSSKENQSEEQREPLKGMVQGHFRALVSQLLQGEGIEFGADNGTQDWLNIVSTLAWHAANFVKPDTSRGGSMDPGNYVKIKCLATGSPNESTLIKGVVCTKNIKHKRMTSQYKNPRLLLLGGSLEYQRAQNQLASFNTLLEEEMNHLKMIVSKIEAHRPNVLLVEKSVSSYAQEYLLAKEISLVLNVKKPLLERIARCTGALIIPSVDNISLARVGRCELFRLERVSEQLERAGQSNKKTSKTFMYFEGCPRRLGCTVLLKGLCRQELKKIKHVVQYAVFAAYHLSLETSFLADEGAHLPKMTLRPLDSVSDNLSNAVSNLHIFENITPSQELDDVVGSPEGDVANMDDVDWEPAPEQLRSSRALPLEDASADNMSSHVFLDGSICNGASESTTPVAEFCSLECNNAMTNTAQSELVEAVFPENAQVMDKIDENEVSSDYFAAAGSQRSILVSFSSHCVSKGALCERSRLLRIRFYGSFDKPLGRYLRDDLFDQASLCRSCKEPMEEHVQCYTHRQGSLTINVKRLNALKLPGSRDGKIWMWHRCLRCAQIDGVPPATRRVIMSYSAWGLSFGKFLELSFSNHATANRLASCGHSLQRDCLRFYGFGSMVAFFHYSPIDILTVHLPSSVLDFIGHSKQDWIIREVEELKGKVENFYADNGDVLHLMEQKSASLCNGSLHPSDLHKRILELKDLLDKEIDDYYCLLEHAAEETSPFAERTLGILDLNRLRRSLLIGSHTWYRRLYSLDSLLNSKSLSFDASEDLKNDLIKDSKLVIDHHQAENSSSFTEPHISETSYEDSFQIPHREEVHGNGEESSESEQSPQSNLSDKIDSAWTGTDVEVSQAGPVGQVYQVNKLPHKRLMPPTRLYSFDSAMRLHERLHRGLPPSQLSAARSFHASGDYRNMIRDPSLNFERTYSQLAPYDANFTPSFVSSAPHLGEGPRLLLPQSGLSDLVVAVYDDEPTSVISYALSSKEYDDWVSDKLSQNDGSSVVKDISREDSTPSTFLSWQTLGSLDLDYINYTSYGSEDATPRSLLFSDSKKSPHFHISFDDDSSYAGGKAKFSVTCYFAKQFNMLLNKCCPSIVDFVCSLSRCRRWSAQGGKSNVYFAKSMDERFIIKQVTKTELESFQEFAPQYFKYLNDSLDSGSPTCLAKIFGIFQVTIKQLKSARETKMDLMVMENLFFKRSISRVYDLKGSLRSRYNSDTKGANKVLLDMNLLETLRTSPIFLGSKAKRRLERAVWNDTSFLASVDVMDYSLLVGVDEERKELVLGIIDFMRQYTWDKHLETWVKATGILGGPKNASPTIVSPKQYKKRFRKAMTTYFLTVPDEWSS